MTADSHSAPADGNVMSGDLRIHYLEHGTGPLDVVVVPGITSPAMTWAFVGEAISKDGDVRVLTMDVRGRGLSDRAEAGGYTLRHYADDVATLVRSLRLERPAILGHSMGARAAAAFGVLYPALCGPVIVVDPPLSGPGREPYPFPLGPYVEALRKAQRGATADDMREQFPTWGDEQLQLRAEWLATCDEIALVESYENFQAEDFFAYWEKLASPVMFIYGKESPVVPGDSIHDVASCNPRARVVGIPGAGHMIPWDNLAEFVAEVRSFLGLTVARGKGN
jgi:N-formylmaleamate deformylase